MLPDVRVVEVGIELSELPDVVVTRGAKALPLDEEIIVLKVVRTTVTERTESEVRVRVKEETDSMVVGVPDVKSPESVALEAIPVDD